MKYLFLHYPACGTCRKAARWLAEHGVEAESRDIVLSNPGRDELSQWIATSGLPARKFFNTSGQRYKELNLKEKVTKASDGELIALLATEARQATVARRPRLRTGRLPRGGMAGKTARPLNGNSLRPLPKPCGRVSRSLPTLSALQNKHPSEAFPAEKA